MVIVHEIKDDDDEFNSQLVDSIDDYITDDEDYESEEYDSVEDKPGPFNFLTSIIPIRIRNRLSIWSERALSSSIYLAKMTGKAAWILTTSVLLVGLPLLYAYDREKSLVDYEKEQQRFAPPVSQ